MLLISGSNVTVSVDREVSISCHSRQGNPVATIKWFIGNSQLYSTNQLLCFEYKKIIFSVMYSPVLINHELLQRYAINPRMFQRPQLQSIWIKLYIIMLRNLFNKNSNKLVVKTNNSCRWSRGNRESRVGNARVSNRRLLPRHLWAATLNNPISCNQLQLSALWHEISAWFIEIECEWMLYYRRDGCDGVGQSERRGRVAGRRAPFQRGVDGRVHADLRLQKERQRRQTPLRGLPRRLRTHQLPRDRRPARRPL